jgi:uncharacterized protein YjbJ (UPF0337 family)
VIRAIDGTPSRPRKPAPVRQPSEPDGDLSPWPAQQRRVTQQAQEQFMNADQIEGSWDVVKGKLQKQSGHADQRRPGRDRRQSQGNAGRIQQRSGYAKERVERELNAWIKTL